MERFLKFIYIPDVLDEMEPTLHLSNIIHIKIMYVFAIFVYNVYTFCTLSLLCVPVCERESGRRAHASDQNKHNLFP